METNQVFYLVDIDNGELLASHFCSHSGFAKSDLLDSRKDKKEELVKKYGEEVQCKFFNEQHEITEPEFKQMNTDWATKNGIIKG